jgi:methylenetetrahydrofolate reductase (NADPH)
MTVELVSRIQRELDIEAVAHLTCVGHSVEDLNHILESLSAAGVHNVMALRGDPPKGEHTFQASEGGFAHATDLIALCTSLKSFTTGCAYYPEGHPEAPSLEEDVRYVKMKQDAGASFGVSQFFFDNQDFYRFRDLAVKAGITIPLVVGIMPVTSLKQLARLKRHSGHDPASALIRSLEDGPKEEARARGIRYSVDQCIDLLKNGASGIHLYTLNASRASVEISQTLRDLGALPTPGF